MSRLPRMRTQLAYAAPGAEVRHVPVLGATSEHARTQAAWLEGLRRIAELHASLAAEVGALVEKLEVAVAVGAETSLMSDVPETAALDDLLTTQQLCDLLHLHQRTLRRMELLDELPAPIRHGRLKRWRRSEIDEWLAQRGGDSQ